MTGSGDIHMLSVVENFLLVCRLCKVGDTRYLSASLDANNGCNPLKEMTSE